uniref:Pecanex-like protein n=1 Tax=Angiostrongylus cantonensis TaxID=6313 RepID=A0A0K0DG12_ANGCA
MNREDVDKVAVSTGIIFLSGLVLFQSCHRASTIYFFELQTTTVIFIEPLPAALLPFVLSVLLWLVYKGTKRSTSLDLERKAIMDKRKELENISLANSRKPSRSGSRKVSLTDEQQFFRLNSKLMICFPHHTVLSPIPKTYFWVLAGNLLLEVSEVEDMQALSRMRMIVSVRGMRFTCRLDRLFYFLFTPCQYPKKMNNITNLFTYSLSALNLLPKNRPGLPQLNFSDIISEFFAVHLPVWVCVAAFYVVLLELFGVHFAYYFYYHEETMVYSAFSFSIMFGLFHEFWGGWVSNDILAFSSIYIAFFLLFYCVNGLDRTVTRECRAPLMIVIPSDHHGNKQSLAAINIIVPGIFLNVIQKYSSMYDPELFTATYAAVFGALTVAMVFSVWRQKITPILVLPAIMAIVVSMGLCTHRNDLWRFMIKYKRTMPARRV